MDSWFNQPFNGQAVRYRQIIKISEKFKPTVAIETGTFLGASTPILATLVSGKTYTVEFVNEFAEKARKRFETLFPKFSIELIIGDSAKQIKKILQNLDSKEEVVLAYLDAHWEEHIPTSQELSELISWGVNGLPLLMIFKFLVTTFMDLTSTVKKALISRLFLVALGF